MQFKMTITQARAPLCHEDSASSNGKQAASVAQQIDFDRLYSRGSAKAKRVGRVQNVTRESAKEPAKESAKN